MSSKTTTSTFIQIDPAKYAEQIRLSFLEGFASSRATIDTLTHALESREKHASELQASVQSMLANLQEAARASTTLAVMGAQKEITIKQLEAQSGMIERLCDAFKEPALIVAKRWGIPALPMANQKGVSAAKRAFSKILSPEGEKARDAVVALVGLDDWSAMLDVLSTFIA